MIYTMSKTETEEWSDNAVSKSRLSEGEKPKLLRKVIIQMAKHQNCSCLALDSGEIVHEIV